MKSINLNKLAFTFFCMTLSSTYGMQELRALHNAVREGNLHLVQSLVRNGAIDINISLNFGWSEETPLHCAVIEGHLEVVEWLLENKADPDTVDELIKTPLHLASHLGNMAVLHCLVNHGATINTRNYLSETALFETKRPDIAQFLIDNNIDINAVDNRSNTALKSAVDLARNDLVKLFVQNGADLTIKNEAGKTALDSAIQIHNNKAQKILESYSKLEQKARINPTRKVFEKAVQKGYFALVKKLVEIDKIQVTKEDIVLAKAAWHKTGEAIYKKIGRLLIPYHTLNGLLEQVKTSQPNSHLPVELIESIRSFAVQEKRS
jgi:uncharacterized protein